MLQTGDEVLDHFPLRRLRRKRKRRRDEILGQPHRALRFHPGSPARLPNVMDRVGHEPESEQRGKYDIEPIAQRDRTPHPSDAFLPCTVDFTPAVVNVAEKSRRLWRGAIGFIRETKSVRVLIVDDHPIIVSGCRALLEGEPEVEVIEAQDGTAGFASFLNTKPDVGVIDINLPGYSGLELMRRILERDP